MMIEMKDGAIKSPKHTYSSVNKNLCKKRTLYKDECSGILDFPLSNVEGEF